MLVRKAVVTNVLTNVVTHFERSLEEKFKLLVPRRWRLSLCPLVSLEQTAQYLSYRANHERS